MDVVVPYNSSPASSSRDVSLRFWTDILDVHPSAYGKAYCETLSETVSIYRKTVNPLIPGGTPSFSLVDTMNVRGVWIDPQPGSFGGACVLEVDDSDCHGGGTDCLIYQASPPVLHGSTTTYRFAMTAELDDVYRRITLLAEHPPIVP